MHEYLLLRTQFILKMAFVITLICNSFVINKLKKIATERKYVELTTQEKLPLLVSGIVSTCAWLRAFVCAFYINEF